MRGRTAVTMVALVSVPLAVLAIGSYATADSGKKNLKAGELTGYEEIPDLAVRGTGSFDVSIDDAAQSLTYELSYSGLETDATQAHVHFGKRGLNGGISFFLCSNLGNGPAGTPACPLREGTVTRTVTASEIVGPAGQGIPAGSSSFGEVVAAMRAGHAYANVHTVTFTGGEIRAQINDTNQRN